MPISMKFARANRWVVNPIARSFAGRLPPFALMLHVGRVSGAPYRTPIMAFRNGDGFVIALTYGPRTEWVRNIIEAGGSAMIYGGREIALKEPSLGTIAAVSHALPLPVRLALRVMRVTDCLTLRRQNG